jgi:hypothetical protein
MLLAGSLYRREGTDDDHVIHELKRLTNEAQHGGAALA